MVFVLRRLASSRAVASTRSFSSFASRPLFCAAPATSAPKTTTGLVGLPVVPNAREVLVSLYNKTIRQAKAYDDVNYNQHIIKLSQHRLDVVEANEDIRTIEKHINSGQVEELIEQAEDELQLLITMNEDFRVWETDEEAAAEYAEWKDELFSVPMEEPAAEEFEEKGLDVESLKTPWTGNTRQTI